MDIKKQSIIIGLVIVILVVICLIVNVTAIFKTSTSNTNNAAINTADQNMENASTSDSNQTIKEIDCSCEKTFDKPYPVEWSGQIIATFVSGLDLGIKNSDQSGEYKQFYVDGNGMYKGDSNDLVRVKGRLIGITCAYANTIFHECVGEVEADSIEKIK